MSKYKKRKTKVNKVPTWRNQHFPQFHGIADSLTRKVGLNQQVYGGWFKKADFYLSAILCITEYMYNRI